jgi:hypothetical protein
MLSTLFPGAFKAFVLAALLSTSLLMVNGKFDPYADNGGTIVGTFRAE